MKKKQDEWKVLCSNCTRPIAVYSGSKLTSEEDRTYHSSGECSDDSTTITVYKKTVKLLNKFRLGGETWDEFFNRVSDTLKNIKNGR